MKNFFLLAMPALPLLLDGCYTPLMEGAQEAYDAVRRDPLQAKKATGSRVESGAATGRLFGLMCATEQIILEGTEIMVAQMKAPDNWFRRQRLNPHGDESWNEIAINSLLRLHAPLRRRRSPQLSLSLQAR